MFTVGLGAVANAVFTITTMLIAVPTGIKVFNWLGTIWGGSIRFTTPMLFSLGFIAMFLMGGISGVMHAVSPSDAQQQDTYFIPAHLHYVLFGGAIMGILSGIFYWFPKYSGKMYSERQGKISFWLIMIGQNVTFFPMHFLGLAGMLRRYADYPEAFAGWNMVASIGSYISAFSALLFVFILYRTFTAGERVGANPWGEGATTMEWKLPSPPAFHTYEELPVIK